MMMGWEFFVLKAAYSVQEVADLLDEPIASVKGRLRNNEIRSYRVSAWGTPSRPRVIPLGALRAFLERTPQHAPLLKVVKWNP
jgi:hypothetical protein